MQIHVRSVQAPRWVIPVLILAALALIPFALALGMALAAAALVASALRLLVPSSDRPLGGSPSIPHSRADNKISNSPAIDAEYEVRETHEKK